MSQAEYPIHPDHEIFMFCGHINGDYADNDMRTGYAIAEDHESAVSSMKEYGFVIAAISSLADIRESMAILELIAEQNPGVEPYEYTNLIPHPDLAYRPDQVFTFVGRYRNGSPYSKVGFAVADCSSTLAKHLEENEFELQSVATLEDLRLEAARMAGISSGNHDIDEFSFINLKLSS